MDSGQETEISKLNSSNNKTSIISSINENIAQTDNNKTAAISFSSTEQAPISQCRIFPSDTSTSPNNEPPSPSLNLSWSFGRRPELDLRMARMETQISKLIDVVQSILHNDVNSASVMLNQLLQVSEETCSNQGKEIF